MRPVPISDAMVAYLGGGHRHVLAAPNGDLTDPDVAPLEVLLQQAPDGTLQHLSLWVLDPVDVQVLAAGGYVALAVVGRGHPPVALFAALPSPTQEGPS